MSDLTEALGAVILADADPDDPTTHLDVVRRADEAHAVTQALLQQSVNAARAGGQSWQGIGDALGMSRQAAQQRFGREPSEATAPDEREERRLGPVTAFDEMAELEAAGRLGWRTVAAGWLHHRMVRTPTQWEHRRVTWATARRAERDGWQIAVRAFPWVYLVRDTGVPAEAN